MAHSDLVAPPQPPATDNGFFRRERRPLVAMGAVIAALTILGWGALIWLVAPEQYSLGTAGVFGVGLGVTAYVLGMRHAFDADHIAAIDNTTRSLVQQGQRPVSVGFWFSLGHSTVVFVLCLLLAFGVRTLAGSVEDGDSTLQQVFGTVGTTVSGVFLVVIGLINLVILVRLVQLRRRMRDGHVDSEEWERHLAQRGFFNRFAGRLTKTIRKPWQIYPVGVLFGLGFDTATEISLLVLAGGAAAFALPWYAILVLPVLFAAGMSLLDTIDGVFMARAYGWAMVRPSRQINYNIIVTGLSVAVALIIGGIELVSLLAESLGVDDGFVGWVASINLDYVGFIIVGVFAIAWGIALALWKLRRSDEASALAADAA